MSPTVVKELVVEIRRYVPFSTRVLGRLAQLAMSLSTKHVSYLKLMASSTLALVTTPPVATLTG
ncbi:hypothetical protein D3C86_1404730 [compost metagenome]